MNGSIASDTTLAKERPETRQTTSTAHVSQLFSLKDRTVIVTGAGRGLGVCLATAVLEAGGDVVCLDILPSPSTTEWNNITAIQKADPSVDASYQQCDITSEDAVSKVMKEAAARAAARGKPIRGLISCAGIQQMTDAIDYPINDFRRIFEVNVLGSFLIGRYFANLVKEQGDQGSIVMIASMSGQIANRVSNVFTITRDWFGLADRTQGIHCTAYNSSKAAVQQMTRSLAVEWGQYGIRVNSLSPGYIRTAMTDQLLEEKPELETLWMAGALLGRLGAPEDFKAPAVFLLADGSTFMTGADLRVDGGHCASA